MDDDPRSVAIAQRWGFTAEGHPIQSELTFKPDAPLHHAVLNSGVTVEDGAELNFPDRDAVGSMLRTSDTSPEAAAGMTVNLTDLAATIEKGQTPVVALVRVHGNPAAITFGTIDNGTLRIMYTGVDPKFRRQGLGRLVKHTAHVYAEQQGADRSATYNDEQNTAIRRLNASLGYKVKFGYYRMVQTVETAPDAPTSKSTSMSASPLASSLARAE